MQPRDRWILAGEAGLIVAAAGLLFARLFPTLPSDFAMFYGSARALRLDVSAASVYSFTPIPAHMGPTPSCSLWPWRLALAYPPLFALLLEPLTLLPCEHAALVWALFNGALATVFLWLTGELLQLSVRPFAFFSLAAATSYPLLSGLRYGQIHLLIAVLLALAAWCLARDRPVVAGISLALAAWIQLIPGLFLVAFVLTRAWRAALAMASTGLALLGVMLLAVGPSWIPAFVARLRTAPVDGAAPGATSAGLISWMGQTGVVLTLLAAAAYVAVLCCARAGPAATFWWTASSMIVLSPVAWPVFLTWLLPTYMGWWIQGERWLRVLLGVLLVAASILIYLATDIVGIYWLILLPTWLGLGWLLIRPGHNRFFPASGMAQVPHPTRRKEAGTAASFGRRFTNAKS